MENKRGQITIFIILAVVVISGVILFFVLRNDINLPGVGGDDEPNPSGFLSNCVQEKIDEGVNLIMKQGGYISPQLSREWEGEDISYLCYSSGYYVPCISQEPLLMQRLKNELKDYIKKDMKDCFDDYAVSLDNEGYEVQARYNDFDIVLARGKIIIKTEANIKYTRSGQTGILENPSMTIYTKYYDLGIVAQEIISQEAEYCYFEDVGFGLFYPLIKVERFKTGDLDKIYTVTHKSSEEQFRFAIRGCVIPPGY
jgi:hypothetical protein